MTEYNTFVFKGELQPENGENPLVETFCGTQSTAWARGHALREKDQLEDFVRSCADGTMPDGDVSYMAQQLMEQLSIT